MVPLRASPQPWNSSGGNGSGVCFHNDSSRLSFQPSPLCCLRERPSQPSCHARGIVPAPPPRAEIVLLFHSPDALGLHHCPQGDRFGVYLTDWDFCSMERKGRRFQATLPALAAGAALPPPSWRHRDLLRTFPIFPRSTQCEVPGKSPQENTDSPYIMAPEASYSPASDHLASNSPPVTLA